MIQRIGLLPASLLISATIGSASASVMVSTTSTPSSPICTAAFTNPPTSIQTLPCTWSDCTAGGAALAAGACPPRPWPAATVIVAATNPATHAIERARTLLGPTGELLHELGQRRLGATPRGFERQMVFLGVFLDERVLPGQMTGYFARLARHLHRGAARVWRHRHLIGQLEAVRLDQRLGQVVGVFDHVDVRQVAAVAEEALRHGGLVAQRQPVAPDPSGLEVRRLHHQHVAIP